jgi:hypothetical protein
MLPLMMLLLLLRLVVILLLLGRLQRERAVVMQVKYVGYRYAGVSAIAGGAVSTGHKRFFNKRFNNKVKCPGVMHAMTMTRMVVAREGHVRLMLRMHGR